MASPGAESAASSEADGTADELLERLMQCDEQLVQLLRTASTTVSTLAAAEAPPAAATPDSLLKQWFATLHDIQLTLRQAAHTLRQARLPPVLPPAAAQARLQGEAGVAGQAHTLDSSMPYSLSTLRLREEAWRHLAEAFAHEPASEAPLVARLRRGAALDEAPDFRKPRGNQ
ncbi:Uncharacterized protein MSYG_3592 [Malassezia sympodialis ATCC 42132]|uniref:Mediator of RNA polymerase II transcription subunit 11 n=1 Tax=Malassezia sympodialis (strain ATCC 42132) TaxID=1230383 RepID=A0A1M8AA78_MALS4|nr:Uncharacterized protein MSYG_3592 [Malassezia sympodialis ATCC 42132]